MHLTQNSEMLACFADANISISNLNNITVQHKEIESQMQAIVLHKYSAFLNINVTQYFLFKQ